MPDARGAGGVDPDEPRRGLEDPLVRSAGTPGHGDEVREEIIIRSAGDAREDDVVIHEQPTDVGGVGDTGAVSGSERAAGPPASGGTDRVREGGEENRNPTYSEGQEQRGQTAEKERVGDFATGQKQTDVEMQGDLTAAPGSSDQVDVVDQESLPEGARDRRFSEGQEQLPDAGEKQEKGDFASGMRQLDDDETSR